MRSDWLLSLEELTLPFYHLYNSTGIYGNANANLCFNTLYQLLEGSGCQDSHSLDDLSCVNLRIDSTTSSVDYV